MTVGDLHYHKVFLKYLNTGRKLNFEILIFDCRKKCLSQKRRITDCNEERSGVKRKRDKRDKKGEKEKKRKKEEKGVKKREN